MGESVMTDVARRMHRFSFGIASAAPLSRLPRSTPERHLLCVGAIKPRKGLVELVRAFSTYVRRTPEPRLLHLVGTYDESSSYIQELRRVMVEEGVENRVVLHGRVSADELERLYQLADLFVMLSISTATDFEGFGLVFLEAASRGLPCLGSRGSGCHEALQEGVTGLSAFPHERELLAEHMVSLLDRQLVSAEACRAWADAHSIAQQTERFLGVYAQASGN
jgi:glycosyltransferase involved in cell wall biosynthesis